ncbi:DUF2459 domain-containing protein [Pseudophaeobacter sp.]|uniref:DUF2459 domain-containing protein n=1 Tax=Pseudophaeobacter sp. TaxID=1971739 RepID=UPI003296F401
MIRLLAKALLLPLGFATTYCLAALIGAVIPAGPTTSANVDRHHEVLLVAGPIHYDFLLPLNKTTRARFQFLEPSGLPVTHPDAQWLVIGWGARAFYTTNDYSELTASTVLKGVFGDRSVLRVDVLGALPNLPDLPVLRFDEAELGAFLTALTQSFEQSSGPTLQSLDHPGFTASDRFFAAKGSFHLLRTCNTWVSRMIQASRQRFGYWTPLPVSVRISHWLYATS